MSTFRGPREAFGRPGLEPRWSAGAKDGVGTAYCADSRIWFTLRDGAVTEIYYPYIDRPQLRDVQFLVTDGQSFFHEERRDLETYTERLHMQALGYRVVNSDRAGRYRIEKEIIAAPHQACLLQRTCLHSEEDLAGKLKLFVLCNPHLGGAGWDNNAYVAAGSVIARALLSSPPLRPRTRATLREKGVVLTREIGWSPARKSGGPHLRKSGGSEPRKFCNFERAA